MFLLGEFIFFDPASLSASFKFVGSLILIYLCIDSSLPELHSWYSDLLPGRYGDRNPVGARFSAIVQSGRGAHPASYRMGAGSFPGEARQGRGIDHTP
jgi:hypothetical protein